MVRRRRSQRGYALLTALVILLLVSISLALLAGSLQIRMRLIQQEAKILHLGALSDAALGEALYNLTYDRDFTGKDEHDFGGGKIASEVERIATERYRVRAEATYAGEKRTVEAEVLRTYRGARVVRWRRDPGR
jgi:type II secretory pathway component PulK